MIPVELLSAWRARAAEVEHHLAPADLLWKRAVQELEDALHEEAMKPLTLEEAHELGGYSVDHLARELREGRIPNAGRKHAPRILRKDVPIKVGHQPKKVAPPLGGTASSSGARARRAALSLETRRG